MAKAEMNITFPYPLQKVWDYITSTSNTAWRSDLEKCVLLDSTTFQEYTKQGYVTEFHIVKKDAMKHYEFTLENTNMSGRWIGLFEGDEHQCTVHFIEEIQVKKAVMKLIAPSYLKKQQKLYVADLQKVLHEN